MNVQPTRLSPLHGIHVSAGATIVSLENWQVATAIGPSEAERAAASTGLGLADLSDRAKIMVEGANAGALLKDVLGGNALSVNQMSKTGGSLYVASLRQDRFYVSGRTGAESDLLTKLNDAAAESSGLITVTDETDARSELLLIGPNASTCLSRVCALDFHEDVFPTLTAKQTSVAKIRQLVLRCDNEDTPAYIVSGGQSNAIYLWKTLLDAGHDLQMQAIGREAVHALWA
ncbi:MAG: hypothetical protein AAF702_02575 [Chloroflexota bacterium]